MMDWVEITVHTTTFGAEIVSEQLIQEGATGTMVEDRADIPDPTKPNGIWEIIDQKLIDAMGMGRIHYCGTHDNSLMDSFFEIPHMTGVDFDGKYHDLWELCERTPENLTLLVYATGDVRKRLLAGDWPKKRNIIIQSYVSSIEDGRALYDRLRSSMPY